jgi:glucosamine-6-phosphate deaminase
VELAPATTSAAARYGDDAAPRTGMTLGMHAIMGSSEIWLLVTGGHKAHILDRVVHGPLGPDVPATYLREHPDATLLADRSAAVYL